MGYGVMGYRVSLPLLASKIGIADKARRMAVRRAMMASFTGARMGHRRGFSIAVSNLLIGPPWATGGTSEAADLGYALEALCDAFGTSLFNNPVSPCRTEFLEGVRALLASAGTTALDGLLYGGAPLAVPSAGDFPTIGHLDEARVVEFASALAGKDLRALAGVDESNAAQHAGTLEAAELFREWADEARQHGEALVAFYY